jgi:hypothetical protein
MELKYPRQRHYEAALLEFDREKLTRLVALTEEAMFRRLQALSTSPDGHDERQAIEDAAYGLLTLKRDVLEYPGLDSQLTEGTPNSV